MAKEKRDILKEIGIGFLKKHKKAYEVGTKNRTSASPTIDRIIRFACPSFETLAESTQDRASKEDKSRVVEIYDTTLAQSFDEYIDTQKARMFPTTNQWFKAIINPLVTDEISEDDKKGMQSFVKKVYLAMNLSNFDFILDTILRNYNISVAITKVTATNNMKSPLVYECLPYTTCVLGEPKYNGNIETVYVERKDLTMYEVKDIFPNIKFVDETDFEGLKTALPKPKDGNEQEKNMK